MKKVLTITLALLLVALTLIGCGKNMGRENFNYDMNEHVVLDNYAIEVYKNTTDFNTAYESRLEEILTVKKTEGVVTEGDTANIDYVGKKDGVAFEGGTSQGYDLKIGSDTFIDGFEDGLIGVSIGDTVDLNLTFPSNYGNEELKGAAVVFTVKVNYVTTTLPELNEEVLKNTEYKTVEEAKEAITKLTAEDIALETIFTDVRLLKTFTKEEKIFYDEQMNYFKSLAKTNSMTIEQFAESNGMDYDEFDKYIEESVASQMTQTYAVFYYIIDKAGVKITDEKINAMYDELAKEFGGKVDTFGLSKKFVEAEAVRALALEVVSSNIIIKE